MPTGHAAMKGTRTIVFGLDGLDFGYAQRLAADGVLPWLAAQLQQGSLVSTHGSVLQGPEWVNAACGVSAAHHGYLHLTQLVAGTYEEVDTDAGIIREDPFYVPLVRAGVGTIVVDLPCDRPRPHDGLLQVVDWAREFKLWDYTTTPKQLKKLIEGWCGVHPLTDYGTTVPNEPTLLGLREKLQRGTVLKGTLIRELMRYEPRWQVLFAGFSEVHKGGHFFWQYQDTHHPNYAGPDHPLANAVVELYRTLDRECARICAEAGDDVDVIVVSDRGMAGNFRGDHLVEPVLERLGLFSPCSRSPARRVGAQADEGFEAPPASTSYLRRLRRRLPVRARPLLRRLAGRERADWDRTRVFQVAEVGTSYLRVNLIGREPRGVVERGAEYEALLSRLEREFRALINPATGRSPVAEVVFPQREFPGPLNDALPDVGIVWAADAPVEALESPGIGRVEGIPREQRSGNHTSDGGLLLAGPSFVPGRRRHGDLRELAPTLLALHGVSVPAHYERGPMAELLA